MMVVLSSFYPTLKRAKILVTDETLVVMRYGKFYYLVVYKSKGLNKLKSDTMLLAPHATPIIGFTDLAVKVEFEPSGT